MLMEKSWPELSELAKNEKDERSLEWVFGPCWNYIAILLVNPVLSHGPGLPKCKCICLVDVRMSCRGTDR